MALLLVLLVPCPLGGQESEEKSYATTEVRDCEFVFAVLASPSGEPRTVRRCPRADGRDLYVAPTPILNLAHVDSVAVGHVDSTAARQVVVRITEEGVRRMRRGLLESGPHSVAVVLNGEVITQFTLRPL